MAITILDPTNEQVPVKRSLATRPQVLEGSIALLDISKPRGSVLLDRVQELLLDRADGVNINRYRKPTFAKPAPRELRLDILQENNFVVEALAD